MPVIEPKEPSPEQLVEGLKNTYETVYLSVNEAFEVDLFQLFGYKPNLIIAPDKVYDQFTGEGKTSLVALEAVSGNIIFRESFLRRTLKDTPPSPVLASAIIEELIHSACIHVKERNLLMGHANMGIITEPEINEMLKLRRLQEGSVTYIPEIKQIRTITGIKSDSRNLKVSGYTLTQVYQHEILIALVKGMVLDMISPDKLTQLGFRNEHPLLFNIRFQTPHIRTNAINFIVDAPNLRSLFGIESTASFSDIIRMLKLGPSAFEFKIKTLNMPESDAAKIETSLREYLKSLPKLISITLKQGSFVIDRKNEELYIR